ncbi:phosphatase 2C-like domain-containing protein [Zychaea mexicana]|uniref:phosphatase 2C-like domain-containing protein n=1 Tax=Zychaea mexicana TaxID=64656 RepID=UPI0022FEC3BD|nr:phosphatase 2C-like domain-containing protein [Zychaea mexicana]KAI9496170.1 phosphatase 2C-like domain-containing protein [Zychaea mexicana]
MFWYHATLCRSIATKGTTATFRQWSYTTATIPIVKTGAAAATSTALFHTARQCRRSAAVISQQEKLAARSNLNVIDFFDPALASQPPYFTLKHGAAGYAKSDKKPTTSPQEDAIYSSIQIGDDAYFKRHDALGVADGVGGWRKHAGANPALYARKLMHYAQLELDRIDNNKRPSHVQQDQPDPVMVLENAYHLTSLDAQNEASSFLAINFVGSTTACIVMLCQDELRVANLGDCGVSIIRKDDFVFRSEEQQHSFNFPYQLGTASFDYPSDAQQFSIKIEEGDIVIVASDGLFDNLFDDEILEEVQSCAVGNNSAASVPQLISDALALRARLVSEDTSNPSSPFQCRAMHEGMYYQGGKADDISVLVAVVNRDDRPREHSPPPLP